MAEWDDGRLDERFRQIDQRFDQIDQRFDQVDQRFDQMDRKINEGFARVDAGLRDLNGRFFAMQRTLLGFSGVTIAALIGLIATQI